MSNRQHTFFIDPLGTAIIYDKDALTKEAPYSPYTAVYPQTDVEEGKVNTDPEYLPLQQGDPRTVGVNGLSNEAMLAVVFHRLIQQTSDQPCTFTKASLDAILVAMAHLKDRELFKKELAKKGLTYDSSTEIVNAARKFQQQAVTRRTLNIDVTGNSAVGLDPTAIETFILKN